MKKIILSAVALAILSVVACKKDNSVAIDAAEMIAVSSEDLSNAESSTQSSEDELDEVLDDSGLKVRGDCPTVRPPHGKWQAGLPMSMITAQSDFPSAIMTACTACLSVFR